MQPELPAGEDRTALFHFEGVFCYDGVPISGPMRVSQLLDNVIDGQVVERRELPSGLVEENTDD